MKTLKPNEGDKIVEFLVWIGILNVLFILIELALDWPIHLKYPLALTPP